MCRRHVRQGSAASLGLGSGWGGILGQHTTENLFHWPITKSRYSQTSTGLLQSKNCAAAMTLCALKAEMFRGLQRLSLESATGRDLCSE